MVRIGLIGAGRWGRVHLRTLRSMAGRCRVTHLCTREASNARFVGHPVVTVTRWQDLIASGCDAVIIATPPQTHAEIVDACLAAGKPCLIEKPLCLDLGEAERLHRRVLASGVPVLVNHTQLFHPAYRALKRVLERRREPIRLIVSEGGALGPFRTHTPAAWDWCPHDFSLCLDLAGHRPLEVQALGGPSGPDGTAEALSVRLQFDRGLSAWVQAGRLFPRKRRSLAVFTERHLYVLDDQASDPLTVSPIRFSARYRGGMPERLEPRVIPPASRLTPMESMLGYFLRGLAGGDRERFGTSMALEVIRLLAACESALAGATNGALLPVPGGRRMSHAR